MLFPFAGLYMRYVADVPHLSDAPRLMFRSRFLFLLLIATVNLGLSYSEPRDWMQRVAATIILFCLVASAARNLELTPHQRLVLSPHFGSLYVAFVSIFRASSKIDGHAN